MRAQVSRVRRVRKCLIAGVAIFTVKDGNKRKSFLKTTHWNWHNSGSHCILIIKNISNKDLRVIEQKLLTLSFFIFKFRLLFK